MNSSNSEQPIAPRDAGVGTSLQQVFQRHGSTIRAAANQTVQLDRADRCWYVAAGTVDVFAVPADSAAGGRRTHLVTCRSGDILFGVDATSLEANLSLLAVGRMTVELQVMSMDVLEAADEAHPELAGALDRWIGGLGRTLAGMIVPRPEISGRIEQGPDRELAARIRIGGERAGLVWLRDVGKALFLDIAGTGDGRTPFPLHTDAWILLSADDGRVSTADTRTVLAESTWRAGLAQFHAAALESASTNIALALVDEFNLSSERDRLDTARMSGALHGGVALHRGQAPEFDAVAEADPLVEVVAVLAKHLAATRPMPAPDERELPHPQRLRRLAASARLGLREIRLPRGWWRRDGLAFAGWTNDGEPVALVPAGRAGYRMFDPATATWRKVDAGVAGGIRPDGTAVYGSLMMPRPTGADLLRFALRGGAGDVRALLLFGLAASVVGLAAPVAAAVLIEMAIPLGEHRMMWQLLLALCATGIIGGAFHFLQGIASVRLLSTVEVHAQTAVIDRLLRLPVSFFRSIKVGTLAQYALGITVIGRLLARGVVVGVLGGLFALSNLAVMVWYSPALTLAAGAVTVVAAILITVAQMVRLRNERKAVEADGDMTGTALQLVQAMAKIRIAGAERRAFSLWMGGHVRKRYWTYRFRAAENSVVTLTAVLPLAGALVVFNLAAGDPSLAPGAFVAFLIAFSAFLIGFVALSNELALVLAAGILYARLAPILETAPETPPAARSPGPLSGRIEVNHLSFRYQQHAAQILSDVSLVAEPGQFIAIAGPSGSGKSTLLRLMLGFERSDSGSIDYDGQNLGRLDLQALRRQFGVVLQSCPVYTGTIFENIVGSEPFGHDEAWEAAELAGIADDIRAMPMGMSTFLTDGATLSTGQRQRLLLARALVRKPKILLLDEATSALDNRTQDAVATGIERLNLTRIVIAHRLTTIRAADEIYVFDKGRVVEKGSYDDLMAMNGLFTVMAERQTL